MIYVFSALQISLAVAGICGFILFPLYTSSGPGFGFFIPFSSALLFVIVARKRILLSAEKNIDAPPVGSLRIMESKNITYDNRLVDNKEKIATAMFALLFGGLGVHKFYLGLKKEGLIILTVSAVGVFLMFIPNILIGLLTFIEFLIYITKSDEEFKRIYVDGRRSWF